MNTWPPLFYSHFVLKPIFMLPCKYSCVLQFSDNIQAKEQDLVLPSQKVETGDEYEGATVIEPVKGYVFTLNLMMLTFLPWEPQSLNLLKGVFLPWTWWCRIKGALKGMFLPWIWWCRIKVYLETDDAEFKAPFEEYVFTLNLMMQIKTTL